jgi:hypothetical protein
MNYEYEATNNNDFVSAAVWPGINRARDIGYCLAVFYGYQAIYGYKYIYAISEDGS